MRQSQFFTKTKKEPPKDEVSKNAQLLIQAGFIHKELAGVYSYLPLGLRVLNNINQIIREEMDQIGGQEVRLTALQDPAPWQKTDRWDDRQIDIWFKTKLKNKHELGLGFTHEEPLTIIMREFIQSYRDLPRFPYQIQTKFRNELRAKSGVMRCREFAMKDLYSFCRNQAEHENFYEKCQRAYLKIFARAGIGDRTYLTFASGGVFSQYSHEFQTIAEAGEDIIYLDEQKKLAVNRDVYSDRVIGELGLAKDNLVEKKSIEVGNIFSLGTRFSDALGLRYVDERGAEQPVIMGSYGIGPGRLLGTIVEIHNDQRGLIWPKSVAPYAVHLLSLCKEAHEQERVEKIYQSLIAAGVSVLYDERQDMRAGEKFADSDLIGIPIRVVASPKTLARGEVEIKKRHEAELGLVKTASLTTALSLV